jgi:hypothetical protein
MRIRGLAKATQPITDLEWETMYATLTQAMIQRKSAQLRDEEQGKGIILSPDLFKIPKAFLTPLPFLDLSTPRWLSTWQARRDWQDMLQSRIDQEDSIASGLASAIIMIEEASLPALRDALIAASDAVGVNLNEQAEWITTRLLIDTRAGGCRMTTRVAQALETLQTLVFDLRTGQFKQLSPSPLSLVSDYFDEEWKWIGSYATWRSAMFVFLYPENILQPSLLKDKTPAFETLITNTRGLRLNPKKACEEAQTYSDYFSDICSLEIEATCQASTVMSTGEGCDRQPSEPGSMFYMFGRAKSGKIYWSAYDVGGSSGTGQTFWKEVEAFKGTKVVQPLLDDTLQKVSQTVAKNIFYGVGQIDPVNQPNIGKIPQARPQQPVLPFTTPSLKFCIPPNPILNALRLHAELNLYKLRTHLGHRPDPPYRRHPRDAFDDGSVPGGDRRRCVPDRADPAVRARVYCHERAQQFDRRVRTGSTT